MDDKKLVEDLYSIAKPWFVSKVILSPESLRLDAYLDHEENCRWHQLKYSNNPEYGFLIHERGKPENGNILSLWKS
jgi:hypothetical protein